MEAPERGTAEVIDEDLMPESERVGLPDIGNVLNLIKNLGGRLKITEMFQVGFDALNTLLMIAGAVLGCKKCNKKSPKEGPPADTKKTEHDTKERRRKILYTAIQGIRT